MRSPTPRAAQQTANATAQHRHEVMSTKLSPSEIGDGLSVCLSSFLREFGGIAMGKLFSPKIL